jgi:hypothetical protein
MSWIAVVTPGCRDVEVRVRSSWTAEAAVPNTRNLVAAGVVLRRDQDQARTARLRLGIAAEGIQDADDRDIRGQNAQANGREDGDEEEDRHNKRDHGSTNLRNSESVAPLPPSYCLSANPKSNLR